MINLGLSPNILLGIFIIFVILGLYLLRTIRYELSRESDIFFTTLGLLYSAILMVHGWRLDPILLFSQFLITLILIFIMWENIRLRGLIKNKRVEENLNNK